jgi:flagellar basal-body rod modification protein FlgD
MGKDEFVKLLVAQMTHQDPLKPMDGQQMAAQLAQFSSVEQLLQLGQKLDQQAAAQTALLNVMNNASATNLIGHEVSIDDDQLVVGPGGTTALEMAVPAGGAAVTLTLLTGDGAVAAQVDLGYQRGGVRSIALADLPADVPPGAYRARLDIGGPGSSETLPTRIRARVDSVQFGADGAAVTAGGQQYPIGRIASITAPRSTP